MSITITEALAELKTVSARLDKKREFVLRHIIRESKLCDPLEKNGGSKTVIARDLQSIGDLEQLEVVLGTLDGQLSLLNATTVIEIDK